jgi:hypothetical protein
MIRQLTKTLEAVWYAAGPAQYLLYGLWTIVVSGNFVLDGWHVMFPVIWKLNGVAVILITVWGSMRAKQYVILLNAMIAIAVGAIYTSCAIMVGAQIGAADIDYLRGSTQSNYLSLVLMVVWGYYLANLVSRQRMEFRKVGIDE